MFFKVQSYFKKCLHKKNYYLNVKRNYFRKKKRVATVGDVAQAFETAPIIYFIKNLI